MKKICLLLFFIILYIYLFISCSPSVVPTPSEGEGEGEGEAEATGNRVVLMELFNADGCKASELINPIAEDLAESYGTDKVILVEGAAWGKYTTSEVQSRFDWYVPGTKHTPFIAFNGLSDTFSEGIVGGGGGGGGSTPPSTPSVDLLLIPNSSTVTQGDVLVLRLDIQNITDLKGASIDLNFDSTYLQYLSAQDGGFIPDVDSVVEDYIDNTAGILSLDIAGLGDTAYASGSGTIMTMTFDTISSGNTSITFGLTELRDKDNQSISHVPGTGCSVTIQ